MWTTVQRTEDSYEEESARMMPTTLKVRLRSNTNPIQRGDVFGLVGEKIEIFRLDVN